LLEAAKAAGWLDPAPVVVGVGVGVQKPDPMFVVKWQTNKAIG